MAGWLATAQAAVPDFTAMATRLTVWGTMHRLVAALYFVAIAQMFQQVVVMAGRRGMSPLTSRLRRLRIDYPRMHVLYTPTLFWVCSSDWFLRLVVVVGSTSALLAFWGGGPLPTTAYMAVCFVCYVSLSNALLAWFPWDDMLLETGFLTLFMPALPALTTQWAATEVPSALLAFAFRWLVFRVMVGFGKFKFIGARAEDSDYLFGFTVSIPLPSLLSWGMHHAPRWFLRLSLYIMFVIEIILPFGFLAPGWVRALGGASTIFLMAAIHLTGNWGHFNILTAIVALSTCDIVAPCLPSVTPLLTGTLVDTITFVLLVLYHLPASLLYFIAVASWSNHSVWYMPVLQRLHLVTLLRALQPFRMVHGYGIFFPKSFPPIKNTPVFEGSDDGVTWQEYRYKFQICAEDSRPPHVAPYHPRFDMYMFYAGLGSDWFMSGWVPSGIHPFAAGSVGSIAGDLHRIAHTLLSDADCTAPLTHAFGHNPFLARGKPPKFIRVQLYALRPDARRQQPGVYWKRTDAGTHLPPMSLGCASLTAVGLGLPEAYGKAPGSWVDPLELSTPLHVNTELSVWRGRSPAVQALVRAYSQARDLQGALVRDYGPSWEPITAGDVAQFWEVLVGTVVGPGAVSVGFAASAVGIKDRASKALTPSLRRRVETVYLAQRALFLHRSEVLLFGKGDPAQEAIRKELQTVVPSLHHIALLGEYFMGCGREAFAAALADLSEQRVGAGVALKPVQESLVWRTAKALGVARDPSPCFLLSAALYPDHMRFLASKARLMASIGSITDADVCNPGFPGFGFTLAFYRNTPPLRPEAPTPWDPTFKESHVKLVKVAGRWYIPGDGAYDVPPELAGRPLQAPEPEPVQWQRPKRD